jgi:peptidoglycan hydrolase-like protein with peptidoglycan-binding domain
VIRKAVRAFQRKAGLAVTGEVDESTRSALAEAHDRTHSDETGT